MPVTMQELLYAGFSPAHAQNLLDQLGSMGGGGSSKPNTYVFSSPGAVSVSTGAQRIYNDTGATLTISLVRVAVGTAPTGSALIVDVNKDGTTLFTNQGNRPRCAVSTNTGTNTPAVTTWENGSYLSVDVDQVGSTEPGQAISVTVTAV